MRALLVLVVSVVWLLAPALAAAPAAGASSSSPSGASDASDVREEQLTVPVGEEPDGEAVDLDATLYLPASATEADPAPAVLLAHGFGGTKDSVAGQARSLAGDGYVVLAWTARGFGASGGSVHLDDPDFEVADAGALVSLLATRPEVLADGEDDPRVGIAGASYGGAVGLLLAGNDRRVDAVASAITWSDLSGALVPQAASGDDDVSTGVFKAGWASQLLSSLTGAALAGRQDGGDAPAPPGEGDVERFACGRLTEDLCRGYLEATAAGEVGDDLREQLARSAPAQALPGTRAAVLLVQGEGDSLFGLGDSLANAEAAQRAGVPVSLAWVAGGHDGGFDSAAFEARAATWFDEHLRASPGSGSGSVTSFSVAVPQQNLFGGGGGGGDGEPAPERSLSALPALADAAAAGSALPLHAASGRSEAQLVLSPAGGRPAALTSLPGVGDVASLAGLASAAGGAGLSTSELPGQAAVFETDPLSAPLTLLGSSTVRLRVTSSADDVVLFASFADVSPDSSSVLPSGLVAPLHLTGTAGRPVDVDVTLPAVVRDVPAGHRLRLVVATTDSAYAVPVEPRVDTVALAGEAPALVVAAAPATVSEPAGDSLQVPWAHVAALGAVLLVALALALIGAVRRRRRGQGGESPAPGVAEDDEILAVTDLEKVYGDGFRAVDGVSFTVRRGQVVGLLGPNGAGKTTTLRMLMGLLRPTAGSLRVLGQPVRPGAPVLARVGALVEGPGFLPHLSGLANLRIFWASTGRPLEDARIEEALAVAGLGSAVNRRVRGYSQGMRQRLGIAQAMLGMPELLVLDEPTNGLDPPQITAMRQVLRDYAAGGRTVLVSSHLLSEVEATCSHAVVMARGRVLAAGSVAELVAGSTEVLVTVGDGQLDVAVEVLTPRLDDGRLLGVRDGGVLVAPGTAGSAPLVAALVERGVEVRLVVPQRHLEEVFLDLVSAGAPEGEGTGT